MNSIFTLKPGETFFAHIINLHSGKALDVHERSTAAAAPVIQFALRPYAENQLFQLENIGYSADQNRWRIIAQHSKMVLDVADGSREDGARIIQFPWRLEDNANQVWRIHEVDSDTVVFESAKSGKVIDVYESGLSDGEKIVQFKRKDTKNQRFLLLRVTPPSTEE